MPVDQLPVVARAVKDERDAQRPVLIRPTGDLSVLSLYRHEDDRLAVGMDMEQLELRLTSGETLDASSSSRALCSCLAAGLPNGSASVYGSAWLTSAT